MARDIISNLSDWGLVYEEQDIRGREAVDENGNRLGMVTDLIGDTEVERIVAIVLDGGREYAADLVDIDKDRIRIRATAGTDASADATGAYAGQSSSAYVAPMAAAGSAGAMSYANWSDDDRSYFEERRSHYRGRAWDDSLEADLRRDYSARYGASGWDRFKASVREGWEDTKDAVSDAWDATKHAADRAEDKIDGLDGVHNERDGLDGAIATGAERVAAGTAATWDAATDAGSDMGRSMTDDWGTHDTYFRETHARQHAGTDYSEYEPFYKYGYESGRRDAYATRSWDDLEGDMRADYEGRYGAGTWDRVKGSVSEGFQRARNAVTGGADDNRTTPY